MKLPLTKNNPKLPGKKPSLSSYKEIFKANYKNFFLIFILCAPFIAAYTYRLGSFVRGDSIYETRAYLGLLSSNDLFTNVSNLPIRFLQMVMMKIDEPNSTLLRLVSVLTLAIAMVAMFLVLSKWHSKRVAYMTLFLFGLSTFSLNSGRFTTQDIFQLSIVPTMILIGTWLKSKKNINKISVSLPIAGLILYTPGVPLILIALLASFRTRLKLAWKYSSKKAKYIGLSGLVITTTPLFYSLIKYPNQISKYLGIDLLTTQNFDLVASNLRSIPTDIFINGPNDPSRWLVGTPVLDIASIGLLILGFYSYYKSQNTLRFRLLIGFLLATVILISTGSLVSLALLIPVIYFYIASGIAFLLQSWFTVFPKNPAARRVGIVILSLFLILISFYHLHRYFVAWPNAPETKQSLSIK